MCDGTNLGKMYAYKSQIELKMALTIEKIFVVRYDTDSFDFSTSFCIIVVTTFLLLSADDSNCFSSSDRSTTLRFRVKNSRNIDNDFANV